MWSISFYTRPVLEYHLSLREIDLWNQGPLIQSPLNTINTKVGVLDWSTDAHKLNCDKRIIGF